MIKNLIKTCLWILTFVPLIVDQNSFFPDISGKNLLAVFFLTLAGVLILINYFLSKSFKEEIILKATNYLKNPLVLSVLTFISIFIISTIFAVDKPVAFWGDLSRAEGLAGTIFFFSFFVFSLLIFERKDWLWFFKLSLFTALILLGKEFVEYFHDGIARSGSFIGNPTFLAGYLLFSISSSLIILNEVRGKLLKYLAIINIILSVLGIFIAQTRGAILGLGLGIIVALIYSAIKGKGINYKIFNLRKVSITLILLGVIFSGVFIVTRNNVIWQKVPGLSRLAVINIGDADDPSTQIRLYVYKSALQSVNPAQGNLSKLLTGWGPENFVIADSKYYYPEQYKYETSWYDRSHNKLLDILVMNGVFGLLAYLAIWFFFSRSFLKKKEFSIGHVGLIIFGVSYFTHLMFAFDQISTYIPLFAMLAFTVYLGPKSPPEDQKIALISNETKEKHEVLVGSFLVLLVLFMVFVSVKRDGLSYWQVKKYFSLIKSNNISSIINEENKMFGISSIAQSAIRGDFLNASVDYFDTNHSQDAKKLLDEAIINSENYLKQRPKDFLFMVALADVYSTKGNLFKNTEYLLAGEGYFKKILEFAPNRPDINFGLAINLFYQKNFPESFSVFERGFSLYPGYFINDPKKVEGYYASFAKYFYEQKDKVNFIKVANRLKKNNYPSSASLDKILEYLDKNGVWPRVNFE